MASATFPNARPVFLDCDPGLDDAIALMVLASHPEQVYLKGITTVAGNQSGEKTFQNARRLAAWLNLSAPVAMGAKRPFSENRCTRRRRSCWDACRQPAGRCFPSHSRTAALAGNLKRTAAPNTHLHRAAHQPGAATEPPSGSGKTSRPPHHYGRLAFRRQRHAVCRVQLLR